MASRITQLWLALLAVLFTGRIVVGIRIYINSSSSPGGVLLSLGRRGRRNYTLVSLPRDRIVRELLNIDPNTGIISLTRRLQCGLPYNKLSVVAVCSISVGVPAVHFWTPVVVSLRNRRCFERGANLVSNTRSSLGTADVHENSRMVWKRRPKGFSRSGRDFLGRLYQKGVMSSSVAELSKVLRFCRESHRESFQTFQRRLESGFKLLEGGRLRVRRSSGRNNPPKFAKQIDTVSVQEDVKIGTMVIRVSASDPDPHSRGKLSYAMTPLGNINSKDFFQINSSTGQVRTSKELDRETIAEHQFRVTATDGGKTPLQGAMSLNIKVLDVNDHSPVFDKKIYRENISESVAIGWTVLAVRAHDSDMGLNKDIRYSIVNNLGENHVFTIGHVSGIVKVDEELDREQVASYKLVVKAEDQGNPPMSSTTQVFITLLDENDCSPVFNESTYDFRVEENSQRDTFVGALYATDCDVGLNKRIKYSITSGNDDQAFHMETNSGIIRVKGLLDFEKNSIYSLQVTAEDFGAPPEDSEVWVMISITDINDNPPEFLKNEYHFRVREDVDVGYNIGTVEAEDRDSEQNGDIQYFLKDRKVPFEIELGTGRLKTKEKLDRETVPNYRLEIIAEDKGKRPLRNAVTVFVTIEDVNDSPPYFILQRYNATIPEDYPRLRTFLTIIAKDQDEGGTIRYSVKNVPDNCFTINPFSGGLMRSKTCRLSYKRKREYHFKVEASDRKQMSSVDVVVTISDSNDHAPKFVQSAFSGKIYENQPTGTTVLQVNATDEDAGENARVSYSIKGGSKVFKIDPKTGIITSLVPLDRETTSTYRFRVIATDHGKRKKSGRAKVKINVEDVNDNSPKFYESNYDVSVEENVHVGTFIFQMKATDDDSGVNKQISYSFGKNGSGGGMFKINPDLGDITVNKQLDRETTPEYILTVLATDHGKPPLNSSAQIKVSLRDVIDSPPFFEKPHYVANIYEDYPIKKEVVQVKAVTRDTLHHSKMQYDITSGNHDRKFTILGTTGSIELVKPLDYESKTQYVLTIQAVYASFLATTVVEINVQDVNDEAPVLAPRFEIIINMQQGMFPQDLQLKIPASDPDKSSRLSYKVKNVPFNVLTVDKDTGILNLKELALMNTGGVTFGVEVSDGENHKTGNGSIRLHVITQKLLNSSVTVYLKNATTLKFFHSFQQFKKSIGSVLGVKDGNIIVFYVVNTSRSKWVYDEKADDDFLVTDNFLTIWMAVRHAVLEEGFLDEKLILEKLFLNVEKLEHETGMIFLPSDKEIIREKHSNHNLYVNEACAEKDSFLTCFTEKFFQNTSNNFINTPSVIFRNLKIEEVVRKECPFGFHGSHCNSMLDSCYSSPCKNNGECINLESGYTCRCHPNFAGKNCQIEMMKSKCSRLSDNPCLNRGVCQDVPNGGFKCKCPSSEDYSDRLCRATTRSFQNGSLLAFPGITHHWHIEIALEFATINSNGLLMYIGRYEHENDFMALEIRDRRLYYIFSAGDEVETISVDSSNGDSVTNGQWNKVTISYQNQTGSLLLGYKCDSAVAVKFGKQEGTFSCAAAKRLKGRLKSMDLTSPLLLGGLPFKPDKLPIQGKSFVGCIRNVLVNQEALNLGSPILDRNTQAGCSQKRNFCLKNPCDNGGTCISSWNTAVCQCPDGFVGKTCTIKTTSLDFTHYDFLITSPKNVVVKLPWSMSVMFRTLENTGVVMEVMFSSYVSYLQLQNGTLHYSYHTLSMNIPDIELNDGEWHHVNITWSVTSVRLVVDHVFSAQVKYRGDTLDGRSLALISLGDRHKSGNSLNGCMKGVMIGGAPLDITSATGSQFQKGCGSKAKCQTNVCSKGSVCKEHWRVTSCECRNGYVGQKCVDICTLQPCQNAAICNRTDDAVGFQCTCPDKYLGQFCETRSQLPCEDEYYSASDNGVCGPCNCNLGLGYDPICNKTNGYCHCKKHHYREILKQGRLGDICIRCDCDREGSVNQMCEPIGGQCPCLPGVIGRRCDMCKEKQGEITRNGKGCKIINTSCPRAKAEDIVWQRVNFGVVAKQKCPYGAVGTADRLCAIGRGWQPPDVTDCTSTGFVDLQKLLKRYGNLTAQTAIKVTDHLGNLLFARENFFQKDVAIAYKIIMALMDFESKQDEENLASSQDNKFLDTVLGAVSTFLDKKYTTAWSLIDENTSASVSLMRHLEEFGVNLASNIVYIKRKQYRRRRSTSGLRSLNKIEPNLLMQLEPVSPQHFSGLLFPSEEHKDSLLASPEWQNRTNRVKIPSSLFRNHGAPRKESAIAFIVLKDLGDLLPNSFDINESITGFSLDVNSDVISVGIKGMESMYLKDPITIEFLNHEVNRSQYDCVFWNYSIPGGHGGGWSKNGCTKVPSNFTHTICKCHHLTSFAVVSDLRMEVPVISPYTVQIITYVGVSVSLAILLVAFLSFTCLSGLNSNTNSIHKNMVLAIVIAELVYMIGINRTSSKLLCRFVAIILHFFFDAVFAWMFVEVIHMYRRLIEKRNIDSGQMTFYYFVGWGCPAIVVGLSTGMTVEDYGNEKFCWMTTDGTLIWTFTIPIAAVIVLNTLVFLVALRLSIKKVRRKRKRQTYNPKNAPVTSVYKNTLKIKYALKVGAACLPLLGITLAFAVLAVNKDMLLFHYLFALLCCCQALFVFLFYVVFDTKVRDEYKNAFVRWKTGDKNYGRPRRKRLFEMSYHPGANLAGEDGYGVRGMNPETTSTDHSTSTLHSLSMTRTSKSDPFTTFPEDDSETDFKEVKDRKPRKRDPVDMESAARMWNAPEKSEISTTQPDSSESSGEDRRREAMVISSESGSSEDESGSWEKKAAADVSKQKGTAPLYASDGPMHSTPLEQEQEKARLLNKKPTPVTPVTAVEPFPRSKRPSILKNSPLRSPASPHEALIPFKDVKYSSQPLLTTALPPKVNKNGSEASSGSSLSSSSDENMVMPAKLLSQSTEGGMSNASSKDRKRKSRKTRDKEHGKKSRHHRVHFHRPNTNTSSNTNINVDEARKVRVKALHLGEGKPLTHHDV